MRKERTMRVFCVLLVLVLCLGVITPAAFAAGDAMDKTQVQNLLNSVTLHPQRTGYLEFDAVLENLLKPYETSDTYTKVKAMYDWTVRNIDYSWEGYSQNFAPAYDCFTLTYNLTYEEGLQEAIPEEMIHRSYHSLTAHKGVCYDWAALFAIMARYIGIEAYVHTGMFQFEPGHGTGQGHHGWTELKIDGKNYIFDPQREYRFSNNGKGTIEDYYFGITYEKAWRYTQETEINAKRDAGFLPVDAERSFFVTIDTVSSCSGTVTGGGRYALGAAVTLGAQSETPLQGWYLRNGELLSADSVYTFEAAAHQTIYALFEGDYFCDIAAADWYRDYAIEGAKRGIVSGMTPILFDGKGNLTRAMTVKLLAKAAGADVETAAESPFVDVPEDAWYAKDVNWAWENGLVAGVDAAHFDPNAVITREQLVAILMRYLREIGAWLEETELSYSDAGKISDYAVLDFQQAQAIGLVYGYADGTLRPDARIVRSEGVTFLLRMVHYLEENL